MSFSWFLLFPISVQLAFTNFLPSLSWLWATASLLLGCLPTLHFWSLVESSHHLSPAPVCCSPATVTNNSSYTLGVRGRPLIRMGGCSKVPCSSCSQATCTREQALLPQGRQQRIWTQLCVLLTGSGWAFMLCGTVTERLTSPEHGAEPSVIIRAVEHSLSLHSTTFGLEMVFGDVGFLLWKQSRCFRAIYSMLCTGPLLAKTFLIFLYSNLKQRTSCRLVHGPHCSGYVFFAGFFLSVV